MKKLLSAILLLSMLLVVLASCGGSKKTTPAETTPAPTTPDPALTLWESIGTDVKAMDESLRTFKFQMSSLVEGAYKMKCDELMAGPDKLEDAKSTIDQLVFERNDAAKKALGIVDINYVYTNEAWSKQAAVIKAQTDDAQNAGAADMFVYDMYDMVISCFNSSFRELSTIEGSYFDWEKDCWYYNIMSDMSFDRQKIYVMASDYFSEIYRNYLVLPFNMTMVDSSVAELGGILLPAGETLREGEYLSDYLFQMVQDGKWTWDVLTKICEAMFIDNDGNGSENSGDRNGIWMDTYGGNMASASLYSTKIQCLSDGVGAAGTALEGKLVPTYPATGDEINKVFVAIGKLMSAKGTYAFTSKNYDASSFFARKLTLTPGLARLGELEAENYINMEDTFSVVPIPLLVEGTVADYNTCIHNTACLGAFNINSTKYLAMSAYIQHCSENSDEIKDEYLQVIMKFKTTDFNLGTSDMLDLIYGNIQSVREMILDNVLRGRKNATIFTPEGLGDVRWHGLIKGSSYKMAIDSVNGGAFLDKYATNLEAKQRGMNELMIEWYNLPLAPVN